MHSMRTIALAAALAAFAAGCGQEHDDHDDKHDHGAHEPAQEDGGVDAALGELGAEDEKLARVQKLCPVSDEELGSMGTPIKVMAGERAVFLCCEGCRKRFEKNPDKYLKKLDG